MNILVISRENCASFSIANYGEEMNHRANRNTGSDRGFPITFPSTFPLNSLNVRYCFIKQEVEERNFDRCYLLS